MGPFAACSAIGRDIRFDVPCHTSSLIATIERGDFQETIWLLPMAKPAASCFGDTAGVLRGIQEILPYVTRARTESSRHLLSQMC